MLTVGIDPGLSGAVAALDLDNKRFVGVETPTFQIKGRRSIDYNALNGIMSGFDHADFGLIERVHAMPKQGVSSTFSFGTAYGAFCQALASLNIPWDQVTPSKWKAELNVPADKDGARLRATQLMPWAAAAWGLKRQHNVAEAALLAFYAIRLYRNTLGET